MTEKTKFPAANPSCFDCRFRDTITDFVSGKSSDVCRLKPPHVFAAAGMVPTGGVNWMTAVVWPQINASDWCAEFQRHGVKLDG